MTLISIIEFKITISSGLWVPTALLAVLGAFDPFSITKGVKLNMLNLVLK